MPLRNVNMLCINSTIDIISTNVYAFRPDAKNAALILTRKATKGVPFWGRWRPKRDRRAAAAAAATRGRRAITVRDDGEEEEEDEECGRLSFSRDPPLPGDGLLHRRRRRRRIYGPGIFRKQNRNRGGEPAGRSQPASAEERGMRPAPPRNCSTSSGGILTLASLRRS